MSPVRIGLTLPSFVEDPEIAIDIARTAEASGVDGVFAFDHLFRRALDGTRRPALEVMSLLGAVATATTRISIGTLVVRAWLRPPASTAAALLTVDRIAPGRVIAGIGAGDSESKEENDTFGLGFGTAHDRVERLRATVRETRDRGVPVWVGGHAPAVRDLAAADADGWNAWATEIETFTKWSQEVRAASTRAQFTCSWGGLTVLDTSDEAAQERATHLNAGASTVVGGPETIADRINELHGVGADWVILAALDPRDSRTAQLLGEKVKPKVLERASR